MWPTEPVYNGSQLHAVRNPGSNSQLEVEAQEVPAKSSIDVSNTITTTRTEPEQYLQPIEPPQEFMISSGRQNEEEDVQLEHKKALIMLATGSRLKRVIEDEELTISKDDFIRHMAIYCSRSHGIMEADLPDARRKMLEHTALVNEMRELLLIGDLADPTQNGSRRKGSTHKYESAENDWTILSFRRKTSLSGIIFFRE
ncbi:hypothetical protein H2200_009691 [Cladophialophora chaetospira]|uniref:Uncharacterized protein n=1 Tax=Cladophialophora chaetospira TaxID=386627 RepID=A0AA39CF43_9EURO|nr:hypothetical protein H2200_009691 [Cladophialophora chaetospira]